MTSTGYQKLVSVRELLAHSKSSWLGKRLQNYCLPCTFSSALDILLDFGAPYQTIFHACRDSHDDRRQFYARGDRVSQSETSQD